MLLGAVRIFWVSERRASGEKHQVGDALNIVPGDISYSLKSLKGGF